MDYIKGENTYMSVEEADALISDVYFEDDPEYKYWESLDELNKQKLIVRGTSEIEKLHFIGYKVNAPFKLNWPRFIDGETVEIPRDVLIAILKQSLSERLESKTEEYDLINKGVKSYSIKGASISFSDSAVNNSNKVNGNIYSSIYNRYLCRWVY